MRSRSGTVWALCRRRPFSSVLLLNPFLRPLQGLAIGPALSPRFWLCWAIPLPSVKTCSVLTMMKSAASSWSTAVIGFSFPQLGINTPRTCPSQGVLACIYAHRFQRPTWAHVRVPFIHLALPRRSFYRRTLRCCSNCSGLPSAQPLAVTSGLLYPGPAACDTTLNLCALSPISF